MNTNIAYRPAQFFAISFAVTWTIWFIDANCSWHGGSEGLLSLLMVLGLCGPTLAALIMFWKAKSPDLWQDYRNRLFNLKRLDCRTLPVILFLVPAVICGAITISLFFGHSPDQFAIRLGASFATLAALLGGVLAPALEEAGWRGYGMDSLRCRSSLFVATLYFAILWACWHVPLFFISGLYHNSLLASSLYTANFFASVFAIAFIINWLYERNSRSIIACFLFHLSANVAMSCIPADPFTKCIVTLLLFIVAAIIIVADRNVFFGEKYKGPE